METGHGVLWCVVVLVVVVLRGVLWCVEGPPCLSKSQASAPPDLRLMTGEPNPIPVCKPKNYRSWCTLLTPTSTHKHIQLSVPQSLLQSAARAMVQLRTACGCEHAMWICICVTTGRSMNCNCGCCTILCTTAL